MDIQLSDHFDYRKLLKFTFPSILMIVFTSIYGIVDGYFVSNYVGKLPFAALNLIWPLVMVLGCVGFMLGSGGSALVSKTMGEGHERKARSYFSLIIYFATFLGIVLGVLGLIILRPVAIMIGAEGEMLEQCVIYARILLIALPSFVLECVFQSLMITAERPDLGLRMTIWSGVTNMILDAVFVGWFRWGLEGAASATAISQLVGSVWPVLYFCRKDLKPLHLGRCTIEAKPLLKACMNGSSEFVSNVSGSLVSMLFSWQLLRMTGEDGVAAYGVVMYFNFTFLSIFFGLMMGIAPAISYHFGAGNKDEVVGIKRKTLTVMAICAAIIVTAAELLAPVTSRIFVGYDPELYALTVKAFHMYSLSYAVAFFNIFGSGFFTALNDGMSSAIIAFSRTFVLQITAVLVLPMLLGIDGIWLSVFCAECVCALISFSFLRSKRSAWTE